MSVQDTAGVPSAFLEYGVEQGFFDDQRLDVEVTPSQGGATVVPAVVSGDSDIAGSNVVSVLLAQSKDIPIKIVAPGTFVRTDEKQDFSAILVPGDSDIRSPRDLEGKTLAVNTLENVAELTAKESLTKQGVDVSGIELAEVDFPDMNGALAQGRVDAAFQIEPFVSLGLKEGNRVIDRPYVGTKPGLQIGSYFTSEQFLAENADVVDALQAGRGRHRRGDLREPRSVPRVPAQGVGDPAGGGAEGDPARVEGRERPGVARPHGRLDGALRRRRGEAGHDRRARGVTPP